jgi:hypothetical protein
MLVKRNLIYLIGFFAKFNFKGHTTLIKFKLFRTIKKTGYEMFLP